MPQAIPPEIRQAAIAYAHEHGVTQSAKKFGVSKGSVSAWCRSAGVETVQSARTQAGVEAARFRWAERRAGMVDELGEVASETLAVMRVALRDKPRVASDLARVLAVTIDKAQLLSGGATGRSDLPSRGEVVTDARDHGLKLVSGS